MPAKHLQPVPEGPVQIEILKSFVLGESKLDKSELRALISNLLLECHIQDSKIGSCMDQIDGILKTIQEIHSDEKSDSKNGERRISSN